VAIAKILKDHQTHKKIWLLAIPIMLSNISVPLLGLVDTAILGHLEDSRYLAAVAMGSSLFTFVFWSFSFLRMGTTAQVAQHYQDNYSLTLILQNAGLLSFIIGGILLATSPMLITAMVYVVDPVDNIAPLASEYLQIRFFIAPITLLNYALLGYFIGQGKNHIMLILLISANVTNGILNYSFVYGLGWNSNGIAWATNIAETIQLLLALYFLPIKIFVLSKWSELKRYFVSFFQLNLQLFLRTFFLLFTFAFFMSQGAQHSAALLSANAIMLNLLMFMSNALDGFALASESLVGKAYSHKNIRAIKKVITISGFWSFITALVFSIILLLTYDLVFALLTSQEDVLSLLDTLKLWLIFLPLAGFASYWLDGIYVGLADARTMRNSIIFALVVLFLPIQFLWPSVHGLWLAMYGFLIGRALWQLLGLRPILAQSATQFSLP